jgi:hypothetical protein
MICDDVAARLAVRNPGRDRDSVLRVGVGVPEGVIKHDPYVIERAAFHKEQPPHIARPRYSWAVRLCFRRGLDQLRDVARRDSLREELPEQWEQVGIGQSIPSGTSCQK